ncbi:hypothetical protein [Methyloprofundus sedimenti]|nr:hypothetical protein [Methyloprofundus sedimenti]
MHINVFAPQCDYLHFYPSDKDIEVVDNIKNRSIERANDNVGNQ